MWIVLLDYSPSMFEPFSGEPANGLPGRVRRTKQHTRWEAAKEALSREVESLDAAEDVAVFAFDSDARLAFQGKAAEVGRLREILEGLSEGDGTDIANALNAAGRYAEGSGETFISLQVISDGQSPEEPARVAAQSLARRVAVIDVIIIDPTPEARVVAKAISVRGRVTFVTSAEELRRSVGGAVEQHTKEAQRVDTALTRIAEERRAVTGRVAPAERLALTVGHPGALEPNTWSDLSVYLHVPHAADEVRARLHQRESASGQMLDSATRIVGAYRGIWLTLEPRAEGVTFNPRSQEVAWFEDLQEVVFRFMADESSRGAECRGVLDVRADGLLIGQLPLSFNVGGGVLPHALGEDGGGDRLTNGRMFETIFASYSHKDLTILQACAEAYRALGIHLLIDRGELLSGEEWHPALQRLINESDVFQLYWSDAARESANVRAEWEHALGLRATKAKGPQFLRPLYWQHPMPPPDEQLSHLHFSFLDLATLRNRAAGGAVPEDATATEGAADGSAAGEPASRHVAEPAGEPSPEESGLKAASIQATVLPLLPGESRQTVGRLREHLARAVAFLEAVTGLRYYPVPTLLVDEFLVRRVRTTLDTADEPPDDPAEAEAVAQARRLVASWRDVLKALLLDYHVRSVPPLKRPPMPDNDPDYFEEAKSFDGIPGVPGASLDGIKELAEWAVSSWVWEYFTDPWEDRSEEDESGLPVPPAERLSLSKAVLAALDSALEYLRQSDFIRNHGSRRVSISFEVPMSSHPAQFDERRAWEAVSKEPGWDQFRDDEPRFQSQHTVSGDVARAARALEVARGRLAARLPALDGWDYTSAEGPSGEAWAAIGDAVASHRALKELNRLNVPYEAQLDSWVVNALYPSWRRTRDWLHRQGVKSVSPALDFYSFLREYLGVMKMLFDYGNRATPGFYWQGRYSIPGQSWERVSEAAVDLSLTCKLQDDSYWGGQELMLAGPFSEYLILFTRGAERLIEALSKVPPRSTTSTVRGAQVQSVTEAATYGIFAPAGAAGVDGLLLEWAVRNHIIPQATLPESARVLLCSSELSKLSYGDSPRSGGAGTSPAAFQQLLTLCVTVHEHFHAILETGLDADGSPPAGPKDVQAWAAAAPLNEALGVWMELHYLNRLLPTQETTPAAAEAKAAVEAYISSGPYPAWPYRGAERVEAIYKSEGLKGVRELIAKLRQDPAAALRAFNAL